MARAANTPASNRVLELLKFYFSTQYIHQNNANDGISYNAPKYAEKIISVNWLVNDSKAHNNIKNYPIPAIAIKDYGADQNNPCKGSKFFCIVIW